VNRISVIGAGAWGTALAVTAKRAGREVTIWAREEDVAAGINEVHENAAFLPGIKLDPDITATTDLGQMASADVLILATPAQHLREICRQLAPFVEDRKPVVICAKGIEEKTGALMSEVLADVLPQAAVAVLSGPTFASEVARNLPTAVTLACADTDLAEALSATLRSPPFRIYHSTDIVGAQVGGAVKNVLAIACGIVEGRNLGENARAALITRGLAAIVQLGVTMGARAETFLGLCGIGDIALTCNAMQSRNFSLGFALGRGESLDSVLNARSSVAEGVYTAASVTELGRRLDVDLPIAGVINKILHQGADIDDTIAELLARPFKAEGSFTPPK
jgi:glycerol-3-phosphate dehydrogenase (NAD(P)+)